MLISGGQGRCVMGHDLRMHKEIRGWLTDLRDTEPELGRLVRPNALPVLARFLTAAQQGAGEAPYRGQ
jgi:hypothetical protein